MKHTQPEQQNPGGTEKPDNYLEDHPISKWLITMANGLFPFQMEPNGLNCLYMGVTNHLLTGMILQVARLQGFCVFLLDVFFVVCLLCSFFRFISLWGDTPVWFHQCSLDHQLVVAKMDMWFHCSFRGQVINASENGFHLAQFFRDTFIRQKVFETTIGRGSHA